MRIRMLETRRGVPDGFTLRVYRAGSIYDLQDTTGCQFIHDKSAILLGSRLKSFGDPRIPTNPATHEAKGTPL